MTFERNIHQTKVTNNPSRNRRLSEGVRFIYLITFCLEGHIRIQGMTASFFKFLLFTRREGDEKFNVWKKLSETVALIMKVLSYISVTKVNSKKGLCHSLYINMNILFEIKKLDIYLGLSKSCDFAIGNFINQLALKCFLHE